MPNPIPFILDHPGFKVTPHGGTAGAIQIECSSNEVHTNVSQDDNTVDTFCGTYTSYKPEVWDITLQGVASFGADGLWTLLRPLVGQLVDFELVPDTTQPPASVDNPTMSGVALVKAFPFIDAALGEASEYDVVFAVQGQPEWDDGSVAAASSSSGSASAPAQQAA